MAFPPPTEGPRPHGRQRFQDIVGAQNLPLGASQALGNGSSCGNQPLQRSIRIKQAGRADERRPSLAIQTWPQASDPPHKSTRVMAGHRLPSAARSDPWAQVADWCIAEQPAARVQPARSCKPATSRPRAIGICWRTSTPASGLASTVAAGPIGRNDSAARTSASVRITR